MSKSHLSSFGLLLLASVHVACGGGGESAQAFDGEGSNGATPSAEVDAQGGSRPAGAGGSSAKPGSKGDRNPGADAAGSGSTGGSASSSGDAPETGAGGADSGDGSGADAPDSDSDGVADDRDLCPGTPAGATVTTSGCEVSSDPSTQLPWGQPLPPSNAPPPPSTGTVESNGFMVFVVDPGGAAPMVFRAHQSNVQKLEGGYHATGALLLDVPGGPLTLTEVDVTFEMEGGSVRTLHGGARVPFPSFGVPESVKVDAPIAQFGIKAGRELSELKAPLTDERRYLYFDFSEQMSAKVGELAVEMPGGTRHTLVLDHTDPMFFMRASLTGLPGMPVEIEDAGVGFSRQGRLAFTPTNTWGLGDATRGFSGQMYLEMSGGVSIPGTPISLTGESVNVLDLDPGRKGRTVFTDPENGLRLGTNRGLGLKLELVPGTAELELEMGSASLDLSLLKDTQTADVSGVMYPGKSFFNDVVPILPSAELKVAAVIASPISDSRFTMAGDVSMQLSKLGNLTGLSLRDVPLASTVTTIDKNGLSVHGAMNGSFLADLGLNGAARFDAVFPGDAASTNWFVDVNGELSIGGVRLDGATNLHLDRNGVGVTGRLSTLLGGMTVKGRIDRNGFDVFGRAQVRIPIVAGHTELQTLVNGAKCGYKTVTSAVLCGTNMIKGWSECGVSYAKSCLLKGKCGTPTCSGAPKSCPDFNQPLSCEQEVTIPSFNYGTFEGTVEVELGSSGASASLVGSYCPVSGGCISVPTSVSLSDSKACVTIPEANQQQFCVSF
jgi:hypothetical protein